MRPLFRVSRDEILHFKHPRVSAVNRIASRPFSNKLADSFFGLNFNVWITEKQLEREKKPKETNFVGGKT